MCKLLKGEDLLCEVVFFQNLLGLLGVQPHTWHRDFIASLRRLEKEKKVSLKRRNMLIIAITHAVRKSLKMNHILHITLAREEI